MLTKSKWTPLLCVVLALNLAAAACSTVPSNSNTIASTQTHKLVVLVQGIGSNLSNDDVSGSYGDTSGFNSIVTSLKATKDFASAQYMVYSYFLNGIDGQPYSYSCNLTYAQSIGLDEAKLAAQITAYTTNHPHTEVYIVSHSLGGVLTFAFLADLVEQTHSLALSNGGTLKGIAILDSPLGGVTDTPSYLPAIWWQVHIGCNPLHIGAQTVTDLQTLFKTPRDMSQLGVSASVFQFDLESRYISNQQVASDAIHLGAKILVVGNENDLLWRPEVCNAGSDFLSTEYLKELGMQSNQGALYSRSFTSSSLSCGKVLSNTANHLDVLNRTDVEKAMWETFTGNPVDQLTPVTDMLALAASQTLSTYCNAQKNTDTQTFYKLLPHRIQVHSSPAVLLALMTNPLFRYAKTAAISSCTVESVSVSQDGNTAVGVIVYTMENGKVLRLDQPLVMENGIWKVEADKTTLAA